ncbi:MAG: hypothetical protein KAW61_09985 [candidate division Zixibacteria bacterium]|nr:hypothetical protein [candidate division Zixibacteria bacterium]
MFSWQNKQIVVIVKGYSHWPHIDIRSTPPYVNTLLNVAAWPDIPPPAHKLLRDYYRSISRPDEAERLYEKAREAGPR